MRMRIDHLISEGRHRSHAAIEASEHRMRTIASIATAASHALIPIARCF
jgi:multidrug efflux pump subunit AcrB